MSVLSRANYLRRVAAAYLGSGNSQLTFWHGIPRASSDINTSELGPYYMRFDTKADYSAHLDSASVPMLDYRGAKGLQYNPIAIAQYCLGNHSLWLDNQSDDRLNRVETSANWLVDNLKPNEHGVDVWTHNFDWEYVERLVTPWHSGLAQGQGMSALLRAHQATGNDKYLDAAKRAFEAFESGVNHGGVIYSDPEGNPWIEEYIVSTPTHILNGFLWAMWGVHDFYLATSDQRAKSLWDNCLKTLTTNLEQFDLGWWSLYDQSGSRLLPMISSNFYHSLHIVQLEIMSKLTGDKAFAELASTWDAYTHNRIYRTRAFAQKALFKLLKY
jgi:heparosan-N-sulfate-glucuronate 5-epimerase